MAIFGGLRDFNTFMGINRELINDVISQQIGYYKVSLADTKVDQLKIKCWIERER
jgi:hypothetical protein